MSLMVLRLAAVVVVCLAVGLGPGVADGAGGRSRGACFPRGSTTLAASSQVRAYTYLDLDYPNRPQSTLWVCHFRTGRTSLLADTRAPLFFFPGPAVHVNGRVVGYTQQSDRLTLVSERFPSGEASRVWELDDTKVGSVRATRGGGLAWIECFGRPPDPYGKPECVASKARDAVRVIECDGTRRRLDRGRGIDQASLGLLADDRTLVWRKNGKQKRDRFAVKCGAPAIQDPDGAGPRTGAPSISGETRVGARLDAGNGRWSLQPTFRYRWLRCDQAGEGCSRIAVADLLFYRPSAADVGARLRVEVTATDFAGSASAVSAPTEPVVPAPTPNR